MANVIDPGKQLGGWYNNPAQGNQNMRYWGSQYGWTTGADPTQGGGTPGATPAANPNPNPGTGASSALSSAQPKIDVNQLYNENFNTPEIQGLKDQVTAKMGELNTKKQQAADAEALINDNPYYSASTLTGKVDKLRSTAARDQQVTLDEVNTLQSQLGNAQSVAKQKVDAAIQQYGFDVQSYHDNVSQFNSLLSSGALTDASPEDLAQVSASTGIPQSMLNSIITHQQTENSKPQLITSTDNSGNVTVSAVDAHTGKVISQQSLGAVGGAKTGGGTKPDTNKYLTQAVSILANEDTANNPRDKGDKKLASYEQESAYQRILALVGGDADTAKQVFQQAWDVGGYGNWQPH